MKVRWLVFGLAAALCVGANVHAAFIIPTNQNGADVDVREHEITDNFGVTEATRQRGSVNEAATSGFNTTVAATGDRSNVMYFKFDIAGLPNHVSNPGFWANNNAFFRVYVRNTSFGDSRIKFPVAGVETNRAFFNIRGLEPGHVYADDPGGSTTRTDRSGNVYNSPHYEYNWDEGTGTAIASDPNQASGITFVDAPGITPFCMASGTCNTSVYGGAATDINQSLGIFDDFNSDTRAIGSVTLRLPNDVSAGSNRYPIGLPVEYTDSSGALEQLIFDAQDAGRTKVTLIMNLGVNTLAQANGGIFPNNTFLNFSYAFNSKDKTTLDDDPAYDPDGSGAGLATGSPYSCDGLPPNPNSANCPGHTLGDNTTGKFSPQLIIRVPEPTSLALMVLGSLAMAAVRRRK